MRRKWWHHLALYCILTYPGHLHHTLTFLQVFISFVHVDAPLLTFPLHWQIVAELALVTFSTLALLEERTQHRLWVNTCRKERRVNNYLSYAGQCSRTHTQRQPANKKTGKLIIISSSVGVLVTFADFLGSYYRFKQLVEFIQLLLLIGLLTGVSRGSLQTQTQ